MSIARIHKALLKPPGLREGAFIPKRSLSKRGYKNVSRETVFDDSGPGGKRQLYNKTYWASRKGDKLVGVVRFPNKMLQVDDIQRGGAGHWSREKRR